MLILEILLFIVLLWGGAYIHHRLKLIDDRYAWYQFPLTVTESIVMIVLIAHIVYNLVAISR